MVYCKQTVEHYRIIITRTETQSYSIHLHYLNHQANGSCRIVRIFTTCQASDHTSNTEEYSTVKMTIYPHQPNVRHSVNAWLKCGAELGVS